MPDGTVSHLRAIPAVDEWRDGKPYRMIGWVRDLSAERSTNIELAAHIAVTEALASTSCVDDGGPRLLAALGDALGCEVAVLWLRRGQLLVAELTWSAEGLDLAHFVTRTEGARLRKGSDLPGLAWQLDGPIVSHPSIRLGLTRRGRAAEQSGVQGRIAFPAISSGDVLGVIELGFSEQAWLTDHLARSLTAIGYEIGHFLARQPTAAPQPALTPRQIEVLELAGCGLSARESAARLGLAQATVLAHLANISERLRVTDKRSAVAEARRLGLLR